MIFSRIQRLFNHVITLFPVVFIFSISISQTTGKIRGKILNEENLTLPGAQIFIHDLNLGAVSDADGNYIIMNVPPGNHDLQFDFIGYKPIIVEKVEVSINRSTELNMNLEIQPILLDVIGSLTYIMPWVAEGFDLIWAPIYLIIIQQMYHRKSFSLIAFLEEIIPMTDLIPSATICYIIEHFEETEVESEGKEITTDNHA